MAVFAARHSAPQRKFYQITLAPNAAIAGSAVAIGQFSMIACAASSLSKGSRCGDGRLTANLTCQGLREAVKRPWPEALPQYRDSESDEGAVGRCQGEALNQCLPCYQPIKWVAVHAGQQSTTAGMSHGHRQYLESLGGHRIFEVLRDFSGIRPFANAMFGGDFEGRYGADPNFVAGISDHCADSSRKPCVIKEPPGECVGIK